MAPKGRTGSLVKTVSPVLRGAWPPYHRLLWRLFGPSWSPAYTLAQGATAKARINKTFLCRCCMLGAPNNAGQSILLGATALRDSASRVGDRRADPEKGELGSQASARGRLFAG